MMQVLKVGPIQIMTNDLEIDGFASSFLHQSYVFRETFLKSENIQFADNQIALWCDTSTNLGSTIKNSFMNGRKGDQIASIEIWNSWSGIKLPDLHWSRKFKESQFQVSVSDNSRYQVALDRDQGFIYVFDRSENRGSIWMRDFESLHMGSFITPFRIMLAWIGNTIGGELIHGSAVIHNQKGILLNGPSGSGKSTLAMLSAEKGNKIIADDAIFVLDGKMHAVYTRAKYDGDFSLIKSATSAKLERNQFESKKQVVDLTNWNGKFEPSGKIDAIVLPVQIDMNAYQKINNNTALKIVAPNSLAELFGGNHFNFFYLANLVKRIPSYRLALSSQPEKGLELLNKIASEL